MYSAYGDAGAVVAEFLRLPRSGRRLLAGAPIVRRRSHGLDLGRVSCLRRKQQRRSSNGGREGSGRAEISAAAEPRRQVVVT